MANYWDSEEVLCEVPKSEKAMVRISHTIKNGRDYLNVREFYCTSNDPTWKPSKSGMTFPLNNDSSIEIANVIQAAVVKLSKELV
jgi:hypothetical protein